MILKKPFLLDAFSVRLCYEAPSEGFIPSIRSELENFWNKGMLKIFLTIGADEFLTWCWNSSYLVKFHKFLRTNPYFTRIQELKGVVYKKTLFSTEGFYRLDYLSAMIR